VPIYEYKCSKCGEIFEAFQKINDNPLNKCKFCSGKVERLISQSSFQLKGSGWYLTDYSRKPSTSDKPATAESKTDSGTKPSEKATKTKESSSTSTD
jgi:putative FmdB family regulatory protein